MDSREHLYVEYKYLATLWENHMALFSLSANFFFLQKEVISEVKGQQRTYTSTC